MTTTTQITVGSGGTYTTVAAFASALAAKNFVTEDLMWDVRVLEDANIYGLTLGAAGADATRYCRIRPAAGQGVNDLNAALNWPVSGSVGITLTSSIFAGCFIGVGVILEGFRIIDAHTGSGDFRSLRLIGNSSSYPNAPCGLRRNRISLFNGGIPISIEGAANNEVTDNFITLLTSPGSALDWITGRGVVSRNTFVNASGYTNQMIAYNANGAGSTLFDNLCVGFGDGSVVKNIAGGTGGNNFADCNAGVSEFAQSTAALMCVSSTDYRAKAGGPLIGAASASAQNTLDIFGYNRSTPADVGAAEYQVVATVPAAPTNVVATAAATSASVSFTPGTDNGSAITGYTVTASTGETATGTSSPIVVTGLSAGVVRTFTVKATNGIGQSAASAPSNSVTYVAPPAGSTVPNAPGNIVATAGDGTVSVAFSVPVSDGGAAITSYTATASTGQVITGASSPIVFTLPNGTPVSFTVVANNINGASQPSSASAVVTPAAAGTPTSSTINIQTAGTGKNLATVDALDAYIANLDCVALGKMTVIYVYNDLNVTGRHFAPKTHSPNAYVILYPAPGQGVNDGITDSYTGNYGSTGITLSMTNDRFTVGLGMSVQGFRIRGTYNSSSNYTYSLVFGPGRYGSAGAPAEFAYNRVWLTCSGVPSIFSSEYNALCLTHDNYFLFDGAYTGTVWQTFGQVNAQRNTFVRTNGGAYSGGLLLGANGTFRDNVVLGFGPDIITGSNNSGGAGAYGNRANNYVDYPQTTPDAAIIVGTTSALVVSLTDARPAVGSPIIGGGSSTAVSINDLRGGNRGTTPDAGAFQRTAATPLPQGVVTVQTMDGSTLVISGTTSNVPTSGKISLSPATVPNGAQAMGPFDLVLGAGTFSKEIDDLVPGNYNLTLTLTNDGGTSLVSGAAPQEVAGVGNLVYDSGGVGVASPVTAITLSGPATGAINVAQTITVATDNPLAGSNTETIALSSPNGTFSPSQVTLTASVFSAATQYTPTVAGAHTITATATGSVALPNATLAFTASAPTAPAATALILSGPSSGQVNVAQAFTVGTDNPLLGGSTEVVTLSSPNGTFSPSQVTLTSSNQSASSQYTPTVAGTHTLTASATGTPTLTNATKAFAAAAVVVPPSDPSLSIRTVTLTLKDRAGNPRAGLSGLKWAFFDAATPDLVAAPSSKGAAASTNNAGVLSLQVQTTLSVGAVGWLVLSDSAGVPSVASNAFCAPVTVA